MRKLKMNPDELLVDTFHLGSDGSTRMGTVHGEANPTDKPPLTVVLLDTAAEHTCGAVTCEAGCGATNTCGQETAYYGTCNDSNVWSCQPSCPNTSAFTCV